MQLLKDNKPKGNSLFKRLTSNSGSGGFVNNLKYALSENKFIKWLAIAGLGAAAVATININPLGLVGLVQWVGTIAGGYALNNALRGNIPIQSKSTQQVSKHLTKSIALGLGGFILSSLVMFVPFGTILSFFTYCIFFAGLQGTFEAGIEKYRRK